MYRYAHVRSDTSTFFYTKAFRGIPRALFFRIAFLTFAALPGRGAAFSLAVRKLVGVSYTRIIYIYIYIMNVCVLYLPTPHARYNVYVPIYIIIAVRHITYMR